MSTVFVLMLASCSLAYRSLFDVAAGAWARSIVAFSVATPAGGALAWLCAHRGERIDA